MLELLISTLGGSALTLLLGWALYLRKHKADAAGVEKNNDRTEIDNLKLIVTEWRESATRWKDLADEYQEKFIEQNRKMERFFSEFESNRKELVDNRKEIETLKRKLSSANKRIAELEKWEKLIKSQQLKHGNK